MKIQSTLFILSLCFLVLISACGNEMEELETIDPTSTNIQGDWVMTNLDYDFIANLTPVEPDGEPTFTSSYSGIASDYDYALTLDGMNYTTSGDYQLTPEPTSQISDQITPSAAISSIQAGTWSLEDDQLIITPSQGSPFTYTIVKMTASTLELNFTLSEESQISNGVFPLHTQVIDLSGTITFKR